MRQHSRGVADLGKQADMAERICKIDTCPELERARGWCKKHYTRWARHGDPLHGEDLLPAMTSGVYSITCTVNGWVYIGSSSRVRTRWNYHKSTLRNGNHKVPRMQADWDAYGETTFEFRLLAKIEDAEQRYKVEQALLDAAFKLNARRCYNLSPSARNNTGHRFNAKQSERLSAALSGKPKSAEHRANLWRDREVTPEFREQMRRNGEMGKGRPKSEKHRAAIVASSSAIGKSGSANHKAKLTEDQVAQIKRRLGAGERGRILAAEFGVSETIVSQIKSGKRWRHIQL